VSAPFRSVAEFDALMDEPPPDRRVMRRHMQGAFGHVTQAYPGGLCEVRAIHPEGGVRARLFECTRPGLVAASAWAEQRNAEGFNVYVGINPRRPGTRRDRAASEADVEVATAYVLDLDSAADANSVIAELTPAPRFVVTTGTTPHTRAHCWWILREPLSDLQRWTDTQRSVAAATGGDSAVSDSARVVRLAGSVSYPSAAKRKRGYIVEVTSVARIAGAAQTIAPDALTALCGDDTATEPASHADADNSFADVPRVRLPPPSEARVREALSWIPPDVKRPEWIKVCGGLRDWERATGQDGFALFLEWSRGDLRRDGPAMPASFEGDDDCQRTWDSLK